MDELLQSRTKGCSPVLTLERGRSIQTSQLGNHCGWERSTRRWTVEQCCSCLCLSPRCDEGKWTRRVQTGPTGSSNCFRACCRGLLRWYGPGRINLLQKRILTLLSILSFLSGRACTCTS